MPEIVKTRLLSKPHLATPMDRADFYREQIEIFKKTGEPTRAVEVVNILIFNKNGELFVQKRAGTKNHNPGLLDKTIGGHISGYDSVEHTVMVETLQELQVPSLVLRTDWKIISRRSRS